MACMARLASDDASLRCRVFIRGIPDEWIFALGVLYSLSIAVDRVVAARDLAGGRGGPSYKAVFALASSR